VIRLRQGALDDSPLREGRPSNGPRMDLAGATSPLTAPRRVPILPTVSGDEGSLGEIRKALAGITRRLDALADAVGVAATPTVSGILLDESTRTHLAGLQSLLAIGRGTTRPVVQCLAREGYRMDAAADVGEAVALLGRGPVDLVVTDLALPGGSGLEIVRTVKRLRPGTPVILITGWPGRVAAETLESHGIDAILEKPVGLDTLRTTIATLIERAPTRPR
jgi:CheY-like chemotaxis protein